MLMYTYKYHFYILHLFFKLWTISSTTPSTKLPNTIINSNKQITHTITTHNTNRLKNYLRQRLIECGWREEMRDLVKEVIASRGVSNNNNNNNNNNTHANGRSNGNTTITHEDLVSELLPRGQALVPEQVRISFYDQLRTILNQYQSEMGVKQRERSQI